MRDPGDTALERDVRALHEKERGCGCGYWADGKLEWPHPGCTCPEAVALRKRQPKREEP